MITLNKLKLEGKSFLSKLKEVSTERIGIDAELIKILYDLTLVIDEYYSQNEMVATDQSGSVTQTKAISSKGLQMKCHVCNVFFSGKKKELDIHMNGRPHQSKCEAMGVNKLSSAVLAPVSSAGVSKSVNHIDSFPVLTNKENGPFANNSGERPAVASNVPVDDEAIVLVHSSKRSVTENVLEFVASTSQMVAAGASSTNSQITENIPGKTIVDGLDGKQIPSNKGFKPMPTEIESGTRCDICNVPISGSKDNFAEHLRGKRHQSKLAAIKNEATPPPSTNGICAADQNTDTNPSEDNCIKKTLETIEPMQNEIMSGKRCEICNVPVPGSEKDFATHLSGKRHQSKVAANGSNASPSPTSSNSNRTSERRIATHSSENEAHKTEERTSNKETTVSPIGLEIITQTGGNIDVRIEGILETTKQMFPHAKIYLYGSRSYHLNDDNSDVNIYVDLDEGYHKIASKAMMSARRVVLDKTLREFPQFWTNVECSYRNYLYPVVKADNRSYDVKCTFSFANGSFVEGSKRLSEYIAVLPMIRDFVEFLKKWQAFAGGFHFSSYQLSILVVWYFQYRGYLPSIRNLQNGSERIMCGDVHVNFNQPLKLMKPATNEMRHYVEDFFDILGNQYASERDVICPHFGRIFSRKIDTRDPNIDSDHAKLFNLIENTKPILWNPPTTYMYVHDIFLHYLCPNITANITQAALYSFQAQCKTTAHVLKQTNRN